MSIKIALVGNPNCGKTTMFNSLTGSSQYVGNWPGVTVEKKEGKLKGVHDIIIMDLPGIYSLSPYTLEEVIARNYLMNEKPDAIINIVDATNIERNLYLTTQLRELGIPIIIALNMMDVIEKNGDQIDIKKLSNELGCEIVKTSALKGFGSKEVAKRAISLAAENKVPILDKCFSKNLEDTLSAISSEIENAVNPNMLRWYAIKLFEHDEKVSTQLNLGENIKNKIKAKINECETSMDDDGESIITNERYVYINKIIKNSVKKKDSLNLTTSDKIDKIITNRWLALPIFAVVMFLVYYISVTTIGAWATDWTNDVLFGEIIPPAVQGFLASINAADWLSSLILNGIIGGIGAVLGFLPQMLILFLLLAVLEDCGYMARIAFIMDRVFRKFGLSGKSFIPILIGTGCGVPGIMAARTIENERDRKMTIITTTFIPCSAKLPIIALIAGALFAGSWWVAPSAYFIGIAAIIVSGIMLKKTKGFAGEVAPFVMELPAYHIPGIKSVLIHMWDRGKSFIKKAGTIIFIACGLIWFLSSFSWGMEIVDTTDSMLADIGSFIAPVFAPLGWGTWESSVATISGLVAKENVVGTFGVLYGIEVIADNGANIWSSLQAAFTPLAAYSFLVFNLLCAPCFAAVGAIRREMGSFKWTFFAVGYQTLFAYAISLLVYQVGLLITGGIFGIWSIIAILIFALISFMLFRPYREFSNKLIKEKIPC